MAQKAQAYLAVTERADAIAAQMGSPTDVEAAMNFCRAQHEIYARQMWANKNRRVEEVYKNFNPAMNWLEWAEALDEYLDSCY